MKSLRDLAARAVLTQRRLMRVARRPSWEFALRQAQQAQYAFFCEQSKQTDAQAILRVHDEARAEALAEVWALVHAFVEEADNKDYDSYYEGYIDGLNTVLDEIEALQKKDKKNE